MGMYTQIMGGFGVRADAPEVVKMMLVQMAEPDGVPTDLAEEYQNNPVFQHTFFRCDRWQHLFRMSSAYFYEETDTKVWTDETTGILYVSICANVKNYDDDEIGKFFDWIQPFIAGGGTGQLLIGCSRYEGTRGELKRYFS